MEAPRIAEREGRSEQVVDGEEGDIGEVGWLEGAGEPLD